MSFPFSFWTRFGRHLAYSIFFRLTIPVRRLSQPLSLPVLTPAQPQPPLPKSTLLLSRPSLSSKFAAHISTKSRKRPSSPRRPSSAKHMDGTVSDTLAVPQNRSRKSSESDSSTTSGHGGTTPRGGPAITVSLSPDNLDDYKDLFTLPRQKSPLAIGIPSTPASEYRDLYHDGSSNITLTPSTSTKSGTKTPPAETMAEIARREARQLADGHVSSPLSRSVTRRVTAATSPDTDDSAAEAESVGSAAMMDGPTRPSAKTSSLPRSSRSSRLRSTSVAGKERSPPSIPLPLPPTPSPPIPQSPLSLSQPPPRLSSLATSGSECFRRPRANTTGSLPPSPTSLAPPPKPFSELSADNPAVAVSNDEIPDIDQMTSNQLKQALKTRKSQYDELAARFFEVTKAHAVEKTALENRVRALEIEAVRKDKEIRGFTWMLNNRGVSPGALSPPPPLASRSNASSKLPFRALQPSYADDSGAESHQTSGGESTLSSGPPVPIRKEKVRRTHVPGDANYSLFGTLTFPAHLVPGSESELRNGKRTSFYSITSSSSSSTSSLPPPFSSNLSASALSAIPESGSTFLNVRKSFSAAEREENGDDDVSSQLPSTAAAGSAYSANLKRGRPPSIAQVLDKAIKADDGSRIQPLTVATSAIVTTSL